MIKKIINFLIKPSENLSKSVVKGGFWVFLLRIVQQLFNLIRLVILARILSPNDFGLMGIALLTMATLETFSQTGFHAALIQKKDNIESYLNVAWTVFVLRGFILFAILYLVAPYAAILFNVPESKSIIQVIGLSLLLSAFTNICVIYFQKELKFHKQFIYQLSGTFADFIVAISFVLILKNVWALVLGLLAGNFVRFIVSYLIYPYKPHFSLDLDKIKELFSFGRWILSSSILIFLLTQGDKIFVGKLLGVAALGFYQMAYRISNMPATEITHVISQVTFPAYSKLQDDIPKLREAYLKVLQLTAFLSFPLAGLIFILAPNFTKIFLGEKWMPMVLAMQVLCIYGAARSMGATNGSLFVGSGNPKFNTKVALIKLIFLAILIYPFTKKWGITGAALATTLPVFISQGYGFFRVSRILQSKLKDFLIPIFIPVIGVVLMLLLSLIIGQLLLTNILMFIVNLIMLIAVYANFIYFVSKYHKNLYFIKEAIAIVKEFK